MIFNHTELISFISKIIENNENDRWFYMLADIKQFLLVTHIRKDELDPTFNRYRIDIEYTPEVEVDEK